LNTLFEELKDGMTEAIRIAKGEIPPAMIHTRTKELVTIVPTSKDYYWVSFQGSHETFEHKFDSNYSYTYERDAKTDTWWLYYRDFTSSWEKAGQIFWCDDPENPAYQKAA